MVVAATSWHWLDATVAYPKAARLLRPGGTLAIVSTAHVLPELGGDGGQWRLFEPPTVRRYVRELTYSAEEYLAVLGTYSNHLAAAPAQREQLFRDIRHRIEARPGACVRKHYLTMLQTARRRTKS